MNRIPVILDGDPGHDDAIAWVLAFAHPEAFEILGAVSVSGNAILTKTTYNMLRILTLLGATDIPAAAGAERPLCGEPSPAPSVHGQSGLDGPVLPEPGFSLCGLSGVELMTELLRESREPVTLAPTGPLTDVAALFLAHPELKAKIGRISLMGGGLLSGNWTPAAEFNILVDPEAAKVVFESGVPITMAGLDVTQRAYVTPEEFEKIRAVGGEVARVVADWLEFFYGYHRALGYPGATLHDPVAVAALLRPEIMTTRELYVQVETCGEFCRGATVGDFYSRSGKTPNVTAILDIDRPAFVELILDAVRFYK
ncbi:MAG: nucleoside hydrolase [Firmicutes bacterium]|nr:nucleoside hydrolase [Bacillota bacterium]